jgi:hypothetical protein
MARPATRAQHLLLTEQYLGSMDAIYTRMV